MKGLFRIFELSKNEQRVVLIVMFTLIAIAFVSYERRVHGPPSRVQPTATAEASSTPAESDDER